MKEGKGEEMAAGGKRDVTIKWWPTSHYQAVVDHFAGRIRFVQIGAAGEAAGGILFCRL